MLIRCPTCASGYDVAPELLARGRILRCAHCRDAWVHQGHADAPGPTEAEGPEIVAEARFFRWPGPPASRVAARRRRWPGLVRRPSAAAAASLLVVALCGGALAAVAGKARVVAAFPPSEAVFATIGLPVNLTGLGIGEVRSTVVTGDGPPTLTLEGRIANLRREPVAVPALRIAVRDKSRRELYYWTAPAPKARLAAGETVLFRSRLSAPPRDGQDLTVSFAEPATGPGRMAEALPGGR